MNEFPPSRRALNFHILLMTLLAAACGLAAWQSSRQPVGLAFILYILLAALAFLPLPFLAYRYYALRSANYILDSSSLSITWGMRSQQIPISDVEWVRPLSALVGRVPMPFFSLPGAILGLRHHPDLGPVEFLAAEKNALLLVATAHKIFAISPADPAAFTAAFQRTLEMGSAAQAAQARSVFPSSVISQAWDSRLTRFSWFTGLLINLGMLGWVIFEAASIPGVPLGFFADRTPTQAVPGAYLILLPVISLVLFLLGWLAGLIFFSRRPDHRLLAQIIWLFGAITSVLFLAAVMFIVTTPI
jgi:hypothetical protein